MGILRTARWYIYFFGYMLLHRRELDEGQKALAAGDNERVDALTKQHVDHWCRRLLELAGVTVRVEGRENIPQGPCVFVANHRSYYDIPVMLTSLDRPHALVSKAEVEKIPLVRGWMKLLRCVFVQRDDARASLRALNEAAANVKAGYSVSIFPEGTRFKGREGDIGEFKGGAFRIATKAGVPVVPVALSHTRDAMENHHMLMHPAQVTVRILPAIDVKALDKAAQKELPAQVQEIIRLALPEHTPAPGEGENPYRRFYTADNSFAALAREQGAAKAAYREKESSEGETK